MTGAEELALAEAAFKAFEMIYETWKSAKAGTIAPQVALDSISSVHQSLAANNAAARATEDALYPKAP